MALRSAVAASMGASPGCPPQELFVPFVGEQWDLKGGKEVFYSERRARKEISWEATHNPLGMLRKDYLGNFARFLII